MSRIRTAPRTQADSMERLHDRLVNQFPELSPARITEIVVTSHARPSGVTRPDTDATPTPPPPDTATRHRA